MSTSPNISRWITILGSLIKSRDSVSIPDLSKTFGQHRNWIVDCLRMISCKREGQSVQIDVRLTELELPQLAINGATTANSVWTNYLHYAFGNEQATKQLSNAISNLNPTALQSGINDNPEPWWANELLILHALQSFAFLQRSSDLQNKLNECIDFHLAEIQPDHATNEPWAIHAFAAHTNGNVTAETLLHAAMVHGAGELTPVAQLIVSDSLFTLESHAKNA